MLLCALTAPPCLLMQKVCGAFVYLLFMTVALLAFAFTWIRLPETKGRTFDDIAEEFRGAEGIPLHNKTGFNTFTWARMKSKCRLSQRSRGGQTASLDLVCLQISDDQNCSMNVLRHFGTLLFLFCIVIELYVFDKPLRVLTWMNKIKVHQIKVTV